MTVRLFDSLVHVARRRANERPEAPVYTFLEDGERVGDRLTFGELDQRCRALAAELQDRGLAGERALLLHPPGLEFAVAFLGCLYAGTVAVPAHPPGSRRQVPRLAGIARDARPAAVLAPSRRLERLRSATAEAPELAAPTWIESDGAPDERADDWAPEALPSDRLAFLQYTSGSTGSPKGVRVSHGNLVHNEETILRAFGQSEASVIVSWLPPYHDMGLIGGLLQPLYAGARCILMSPAAFLQKPLRWLAAISEHGATTSGGPDFAYRLCVRRVPEDERGGLDLSSWRVAFTGAEPVRARTLDLFSRAFAGQGFRRASFFPCYGLAESTLFVSGGTMDRGPTVESFDRERLATEGRVQAAVAGPETERLVGCGGAGFGHELAVVDPDRRCPLPPERVGEVWVAGPSVAQGYWERPDLTEVTFRGRLRGRSGATFLRTGDLGFIAGGELFITGRLKDLIILRGRNHHPEDLEDTAERCHPGLRPGAGAAFGVERGGEERLVLVHELERRPGDGPAVIGEALRAAIASEHEVAVDEVVLVRPGGVPRTSSGKVRRHACRERYLAGTLPALWSDALSRGSEEGPGAGPQGRPGAKGPSAGGDAVERVRRHVARALGVDPPQVDPDRPLTSLGLDSLAAVELGHTVEETFGVRLPLSRLLEGASAATLAATVAARAAPPGEDAGPAETGPGPFPLTYGQRALWFLERSSPGRSGYHVCGAARVRGPLDSASLERALVRLVTRHEALRTRFLERRGEPFQEVAPDPVFEWTVRDAPASGEVGEDILRAEAARPFDLGSGPLLRVTAWTGPVGRATLLFVVHHLVADFWSLALLGRELGALLSGDEDEHRAPAPEVSRVVADEERRIAGEEGERIWRYWRGRLQPEPRDLVLPADRRRRVAGGGPRPAGTARVRLDRERREVLESFARGRGVTPFAVVATACFAWLARLTGEDDLTLGTPTTGLRPARLADVVGYLVNPVPLRTDVSGGPTFDELLDRCWRVCVEAFDHRALPFPLLAERLRPARRPGTNPLFQVMLAHQQSPDPALGDLAAFAVGEPGGRVRLGPLELETLPLDEPYARFEWTVRSAVVGRELSLSVQYDRTLFDEPTAERWLRHLRRLLVAGLEAPARSVAELPVMEPAEELEVLVGWSRAADRITPAVPAVERILEAADGRPDAVAVEDGDRSLSFGELARRVRALAEALEGLEPFGERPVALLLERSAELPVGMLAALAAGRPYLPLDPSDPSGRTALILEDARPALVVTRRAWLEIVAKLAPDLPALCLDAGPLAGPTRPRARSATGASGLAYLLFTSGSTGRPKGVAVSRGALESYLAWVERDLEAGAGPGDPPLASAPGFDASLKQVFLPLLRGGPVRVLDRETLLRPDRLAESLARHRATVLNCVPAVWEALLESVEHGEARAPELLAEVWLGGDEVSGELVRRTRKRFPGLRLLNLYGPTETTANASWADLDREGRVTLGRPAASSPIFVLDRRLRPVPPGGVGELCVGGTRLARGYPGAPGATAARFVPDPHGGLPGGRLYRTGDLGRHRSDASLDFRGRADDQLQLAGLRVEPGELQTVLEEHAAVSRAAVVCSGASRRPVAFVVPAAPATASLTEELHAVLARRIPASAVPSVILLDDLPRTTSGKLDRAALEAREVPRPALEEPRGAVEELLCEVWSDLLGVGRTGRHANFFELGGHSLLAGRLVSRVREILGVELTLESVFNSQTPAGLARRIEGERRRAAGAAPPGPSRRPAGVEAVLSPGQWRLWFHQKLHPESAAYNMPGALRLEGALDLGALGRALREVVRRHEILRSLLIETEAGPVQRVVETALLPLPVVGLDALGPGAGAAEEGRLLRKEAARPFVLAVEAPVRALVLRRGAEHHVLALILHHAAADAWSLELLLDELAELYRAFRNGSRRQLTPLLLAYADYAAWRRNQPSGAAVTATLEHWRRELRLDQGWPRLPTDRPPPPAPCFAGGQAVVRLDAATSDALHRLVRHAGASLFMTLLAALQVQLGRYADHPRPLVAFPVADRPAVELERVIGFFTNTVVVRADLTGPVGFLELLARVRAAVLAAQEHAAVPFDRVVEALGAGRDAGAGLVQVLFTLAQRRRGDGGLEGLATSRVEVHNGTAKTDLAVLARAAESGIEVVFEYRRDLFDDTTARRMAAHFQNLLTRALAEPGRSVHSLDLLSRAERHQALVEGRARRIPDEAGATVCARVLQVVRRAPDALAVASIPAALTYRELLARADRLAGLLRRRGVGRGDVVGVLMERSAHLPVAALGILRAGAAYLPLDPSLPPERLGLLVEDAGVRAVAVDEGAPATPLPPEVARVPVSRRPAPPGPAPAEAPLSPDDLSYVIYTSGSTGRPKGVEVPHRGLANLTRWHRRTYRLGTGDRTGLLAGAGFDAAVWETWSALAAGAVLEVPPPGVRTDPRAVIEWIASRRVTVTFLATPLAEAALRRFWSHGAALRTLLTGGDRLRRRPPPGLPFVLVNHYGPTEASVVTTCTAVPAAREGAALPPIGRPIDGAEALVLDGGLEPVPRSVAGELCVGGAGLARGYRQRPSATAERFVPAPWGPAGARVYRTGDLVRCRPDGGLDFIGRGDDQVQVQGLRIELGEIEAALADYPGVDAAAAAVFTRGEHKAIVGYVVTSREEPLLRLRDHLAARLPASMVPAHVIRVEGLPQTRNGKIDRAALPVPEPLAGDATLVPPANPVEEVVAGVWSELFGGGPIGVESDFFELGGHSLLATECVAALSDALGVPVPLALLFDRPTVRGVAEALVADPSHGCRVEETARVLLDVAALSDDELEAHLGDRGLGAPDHASHRSDTP